MFDELKNLNIETCSGSELRTLIHQTLPIFLQACQRFLSEDKSNQNPCDNCDKYNICKEPCELLKPKLLSIHSCSYLLNNAFGNLMDKISDSNTDNIADDDEIPQRLDRSSLVSMDRVRSDEIFMLYKNCNFILTKKEWRVITLKIEAGDTYKAIGLKLGIKTSTASDTFRRAKKKMENYYSRQRKPRDLKHVISRHNT